MDAHTYQIAMINLVKINVLPGVLFCSDTVSSPEPRLSTTVHLARYVCPYRFLVPKQLCGPGTCMILTHTHIHSCAGMDGSNISLP